MISIERSYIEDPDKYAKALVGLKTTCNYCGRKTLIPHGVDKVLCKHCRHYVFKTTRDEFIYRMSEANNKQKMED